MLKILAIMGIIFIGIVLIIWLKYVIWGWLESRRMFKEFDRYMELSNERFNRGLILALEQSQPQLKEYLKKSREENKNKSAGTK